MLMSNDIMRGTSSRFIAVLGKPVPMSGCSYVLFEYRVSECLLQRL